MTKKFHIGYLLFGIIIGILALSFFVKPVAAQSRSPHIKDLLKRIINFKPPVLTNFPYPTKWPFLPTQKPTPIAQCSSSTTCRSSCLYGGVTYNTVIIGTQCWFKENLNVGTMLSNLETPDNTAPTPNDPNTAQKWCYDDSSINCTNEGGLYAWAEANGLANSCNTTSCSVSTPNQGICPAGWHIPSDTEYYTLENYLTTPGQTCDATRGGWDCSDAGIKLSLGGSSGFDAIRAGNHETNGDLSFFDKREPSIHFWSSSPCLNCSNWGHAFGRSLINGGNDALVARGWSHMAFGLSVRCLANTAIVGPPTSKDECKKHGWQTFNNPTFKNQGDCVSYVQSNVQ